MGRAILKNNKIMIVDVMINESFIGTLRFEIIPRIGEVINLYNEDFKKPNFKVAPSSMYIVESIEHIFIRRKQSISINLIEKNV